VAPSFHTYLKGTVAPRNRETLSFQAFLQVPAGSHSVSLNKSQSGDTDTIQNPCLSILRLNTIQTNDPSGTIRGTQGSDNIRLALNPFDNSKADVFLNSSVSSYTITLANVSGLQVIGDDGDDILYVDFSNGNPLPVGGLAYDGGAQAGGDTLVIVGGAGDDTVTMTNMAANVNSQPTVSFTNTEVFKFALGLGSIA